MKPRIIIDQNIPYIAGALEPYAEVTYLEGKAITRAACESADGLIVRTRTACNARLLEGTPVRFIASATVGTDHIDTAYCASRGITYAHAPGCSAWAVVQWVVSALMYLERQASRSIYMSTVGIIGAGAIGRRLADVLSLFNVRCLRNDPPREAQGETGLVSLACIGQEADIITIHTPLTTGGPHPTAHLIGNEFLHRLGKRPIIINAARGGVVDDYELLEALAYRRIRGYVLDTYETEPDLPSELVENALLCTPHIAGYSLEGKANATAQALRATASFFGFPPPPLVGLPAEGKRRVIGGYSLSDLAGYYDIHADSKALRTQPQRFEALRNGYNYRHDWRGYEIGNAKLRALVEEAAGRG